MRDPGKYDPPHFLAKGKVEINDLIRRVKTSPTYGHRWLAYLAEWPGVLQITERQVRQSMAAGWRVSIQGSQLIVRFDHPQQIEVPAVSAHDAMLGTLRDMDRWLANTNHDTDHPWRVSIAAAIAKGEARS